MKKIAWLSDIHLNFLSLDAVRDFLARVLLGEPDLVVITGDIAEADSLARYLRTLAEWLQRPVYFVLGNHDFYRSSIEEVRSMVAELSRNWGYLHYLSSEGVVELTPTTALVGHDGWGDGRYGDYEGSDMLLSDFLFIRELLGAGKEGRRHLLAKLGDEAAEYLRLSLHEALDRYRHVIVATHAPPFAEACLREDDDVPREHILPYYACKAVGDVLLEIMENRPDNKLTVLCGHTHASANLKIRPNLRVVTAGVRYGNPTVQQFIEVRPRPQGQ
jgi:predicted phosphodiesterase